MPRLVVAFALAVASFAPGFAQEKPSAALTPAEAGPDFELQGEYSGTLGDADEPKKIGVQVIALGDGKFRAVGHMGGLPGDGWDGEERPSAEATAAGGEVVFKKEDGEATVRDGKLVVRVDGKEVGTLEKVLRQSPTLGKEPPEGAIVLFAKKEDADNWKGGRVDDSGDLMPGITSLQTFGEPFTLHMEFQTSFMPNATGQARSNSGVYLQGRHEVQMLDSFGLAGENNECGGIYEVAAPKVNMCFPPLSWQTYDIDFTPARYEGDQKVASALVTVHHNGVLIHEDVPVPVATRASPLQEGPQPGPIYIQDHGNPLRFRNIWVLPKKS